MDQILDYIPEDDIHNDTLDDRINQAIDEVEISVLKQKTKALDSLHSGFEAKCPMTKSVPSFNTCQRCPRFLDMTVDDHQTESPSSGRDFPDVEI